MQQREEIGCAYRILDCKSEMNRLLGDKNWQDNIKADLEEIFYAYVD